MANGDTHPAASFLEGLVGGYGFVQDEKRRRLFDRLALDDRDREIKFGMQDRRIAEEDRARGRAFQDFTTAQQFGVVYDPNAPAPQQVPAATTKQGKAAGLRSAVGAELMGGPALPPGFRRVGPSAEDRARDLRVATGKRLSSELGLPVSGETLAGAQDVGFDLDAYIERTTPASSGVNWQVQETAGGLVQVNPETGAVRPLTMGGEALARPDPAARNPTEAQTRFRVVLPRAEEALTTLENLVESFEGRVPETTFLGRFGLGQYATPEQEQAYNQAAEALATAILRAESGAAITEAEVETYKRQFIPLPGDKPTVINQKVRALRSTLAEMRAMAGAVTEPEQFSPDNPFAPR